LASGIRYLWEIMFRTIADFLTAWRYESDSTLKVFGELTDKSLEQRVTPTGRSLGVLAWHITTSLTEMIQHAGLPVEVTDGEAPASVAVIAAVYARDAKAIAAAVEGGWTDSELGDEIPMYGEQWKKGFVLACLIAHQCHHRGQMTVLMRQAGLKVPGIYGPAYEEWAAYGAAPQP
jgi:uncharacterized damage-inducible protein DinB